MRGEKKRDSGVRRRAFNHVAEGGGRGWASAWRREKNEGGRGLANDKKRDRWRRATVDAACEQGRRESGVWAAPGERGPAGEEGKWTEPKENSTLLDLFKNFKKP
jgi:hypothetical protein